jgi:hypothetical protein
LISYFPKITITAFRIYPGNTERMRKEKSEIERLIEDAKARGRWYIVNFSAACNSPTSIAFDKASPLDEKIKVPSALSRSKLPSMGRRLPQDAPTIIPRALFWAWGCQT